MDSFMDSIRAKFLLMAGNSYRLLQQCLRICLCLPTVQKSQPKEHHTSKKVLFLKKWHSVLKRLTLLPARVWACSAGYLAQPYSPIGAPSSKASPSNREHHANKSEERREKNISRWQLTKDPTEDRCTSFVSSTSDVSVWVLKGLSRAGCKLLNVWMSSWLSYTVEAW